MYARRFYRKTPPGYSGVLFTPVKEEALSAVDVAEDGALTPEQRAYHRDARRRLIPSGREALGYLLSPLFRDEEDAVFFSSDGATEAVSVCPTAESLDENGGDAKKQEKEKNEKKKSELSDEFTLIGALLFLLGTGLDSESVLVLLTILILIT